jgi:hypothetical protein
MDYLSSSVRTQISEIFDNVHETLKQTITVYKDSENTMTPSYNSIYGSGGSTPLSITKTSVSRSVGARIKYLSSEEDYFTSSEVNSQMKITIPKGSIRIKVTSDDFDFIKEAKRIEFNGVRYNIISDGLPIGPFSPEYYSIFLTPIDESA